MKSKHFIIQELVSEKVWVKYSETAWQFIDPRLLITLDYIREAFNRPITINDWNRLGNFEQRGLRTNLDAIVKRRTNQNKLYCSAHCFGQAADFDVKGLTAEEVRQWLIFNSDSLPYPIRLEAGVNWVHLDVRDTGEKVYLFNP